MTENFPKSMSDIKPQSFKNTTQDKCLQQPAHRCIFFKLQKTQDKETGGIKPLTYIGTKMTASSSETMQAGREWSEI